MSVNELRILAIAINYLIVTNVPPNERLHYSDYVPVPEDQNVPTLDPMLGFCKCKMPQKTEFK